MIKGEKFVSIFPYFATSISSDDCYGDLDLSPINRNKQIRGGDEWITFTIINFDEDAIKIASDTGIMLGGDNNTPCNAAGLGYDISYLSILKRNISGIFHTKPLLTFTTADVIPATANCGTIFHIGAQYRSFSAT